MMRNGAEFERENRVALQTMQALLGLVSLAINAVAIDATPEGVVLYIAIREMTPGVEEDIDDITFELDALLGGRTRLSLDVHVGSPDADWSGRQRRLVYLAKGV